MQYSFAVILDDEDDDDSSEWSAGKA